MACLPDCNVNLYEYLKRACFYRSRKHQLQNKNLSHKHTLLSMQYFNTLSKVQRKISDDSSIDPATSNTDRRYFWVGPIRQLVGITLTYPNFTVTTVTTLFSQCSRREKILVNFGSTGLKSGGGYDPFLQSRKRSETEKKKGKKNNLIVL
jgi:hypothetical protein